MPLPRQAEIIWKCTDRPDHAQTQAHKKGARGAEDAIFAPDDTSKNPEIATLAILGKGNDEQTVPERAEKVMTHAHTPSMFFAADQIDSLITDENGSLSVVVCDIVFV